MRPISLLRFNALTAYCRAPETFYASEELAWFEHGGERVLGTLIRDRSDNDFAGIVLGRDKNERFRAIRVTRFESSPKRARVLLRHEMDCLALASDADYHQGDEFSAPLDLYLPQVDRSRLHPGFIKLIDDESISPAKEIIRTMMHWYEDADGNFVEQFQTTGFNARIWELYLFATFVELGYLIDRSQPSPDFSCIGVPGEFVVEAVTVNPSQDKGVIIPPPPHDSPEDKKAFLLHYMPIRFGSSLTTKLSKKYWEKPNVKGKPLLFAIHDFLEPMSMTFTRSALPVYLYGYVYDWEHDNKGNLHIKPEKFKSHRWEGKEIPSGFFDLPEAENVSAVIFSNSGTISKFNRMGLIAGFGSPRVRLVREGTAVDHDPRVVEPITFRHLVNEPGYTESWVEGLEVFHNPRAKYPIDPTLLPGAGHHRLLSDGQIESLTPEWHPLASITINFIDNKIAH